MDDEKLVRFPVTLREFTFGDIKAIPRREWLIPNFCLRGHVTEIVGPSAAGKSSFIISLGALIAAGRAFGPFQPRRKLRVAIATVEESEDEQYRRLRATCSYFDIRPARDWSDTTDQRKSGSCKFFRFADPPLLATTDKNGTIKPTIIAAEIERLAFRDAIDILVLDPLTELWSGDENSNSQLGRFIASIRDLARRIGAAVILVHHTGKTDLKPGDPNAARGASANTAAVRVAGTLVKMTAEDATELGISAEKIRGKVRWDLSKGSYSPPAEKASWFKLEDVDLENSGDGPDEPSDHVAVLAPWEPLRAGSDIGRGDKAERVFLKLLAAYATRGRQMSPLPQSSEYAPSVFAKDKTREGINMRDFETAMNQMFDSGKIKFEVLYPGKTREKTIIRSTSND